MKSLLALHLLALFLLQLATMHFVGQTTASATETVSATTTSPPPSLRAPHHRSSTATTRVMSTQRRAPTRTTTTTSTTTTTKPLTTLRSLTASAARRQRPPIARSSSNANTTAKHLAAAIDKAIDAKSSPNSARPLRSISAQTRTSGARQNRSLQSASSSLSATTATTAAANARSVSNNSLTAAGKNNNVQKHERVDRRYHLRTNQRSSNNESTTLKTKTKTHSAVMPELPLDAAAIVASASSAERHHFPKVLEASHRQSKESSMPSAAVDIKLNQKDAENDNNAVQMTIKPAPQTSHHIVATKPRQTAKSSRMIHRLVAGHIQNAEGRSTFEVSAVSRNSSVSSSSTTFRPIATTEAQRGGAKPTKTSAKYSAQAATSTTSKPTPVKLQSILDFPSLTDGEREDDEALLDDPGDFDNWDNGILRLSAGSGKENAKTKKHNKADESKKTLSDQVRDGKYGLIEKELFRREPKRPGILSYLPNKEVPIDNDHNYGGLQEQDIWLAEDHLLVIKGGSLNEEKPHEEPWPAIDDYDAPGRQIKIPPNPKVPPPFPVQLEENGPVQFIGNNKFTVVYPVANESIPVYSVGPETDHAFTEKESDNAKNTLARPGTPQDTASGEPQYVYPAPYPPWLYNNQTFVNPLLSNARPINFAGLGPFPFGRNGSLDNSNGTDYFDEDDPNLYYPPAYSFFYKNNYSNPVPPGPLVPGIVLPPPANHFSRLDKPEKAKGKTTTQATTPRIRIPTTVASTTTTTTTTTTTSTTPATPIITTTNEVPFRPIITKISQYTPKIINITPATPTISTVLPSTPVHKIPATPPTSPTTPATFQFPVEPVPVPVAIPVPISIYPSRKYPTSRPSLVSFVPTTPTHQSVNTLSKSNPIYYEYFEAKRQPIKTNIIDDFLATTVDPPPSPKPIKLYATSKRPFKTHQQHNYLQPLPQQRKPFKENIVYITPKPDIRYKSSSKVPLLKQRPLENFEHEVDALRETLRYYQNQQLRDNSIPRTPKVKPIYEFTFDANKNLRRPENDFHPPRDFDDEPFRPMVTYSPPMNEENSFSPMAYDKTDAAAPQRLTAESKQLEDEPKYQSTTTLIPVEGDAEFQLQPQTQQGRLKKQRLSAKYLQEPFIESAFEPQPDPYNNQRPWVAIGKSTIDSYDAPQSPVDSAQRYEQYQYGSPKNRAYSGYYYGPPPPPAVHNRQNNRFYDEPFRKITNYQRPRPNINFQRQPPHQQQNYWSLENDTYVNYAPNRPPINPDAEFIDPYQTLPINNAYAGHGRFHVPPALSHQSQYYAPPSRPIPLHRDILVNYRQPLPPINPDSEFITHPQVVRHQGNQIYRSDSFQPNIPPQDEQAYYASPKYRRANTNNNNNNNNNGAGPGNANNQGREPRSSRNSEIPSNGK